MAERFAIYFAPDAQSLLWRRAAEWLGRDPATDRPVEAFVPGIDPERRRALTQSARRYGFHATIKPPMALAFGRTAEALAAALDRFCDAMPPVSAGRLRLTLLDGFLALVPRQQPEALTDFAATVVAQFEPFRAPLSAADRDRRAANHALSPRQVELLDLYGYPYVLEQFQFHMTLTDRLPDEERDGVTAATRTFFGALDGVELRIDRLSLFHEAEPRAPFRRIADFPLKARAAA
jgi:putative phosphonate metabolism protein